LKVSTGEGAQCFPLLFIKQNGFAIGLKRLNDEFKDLGTKILVWKS
jgi:hypothetical protein